MIKAKESPATRRVPPPVLNGSKASLKAQRKAVKQVVGELPRVTIMVDDRLACAACKRPFPMSGAERQRKFKLRAKLAKLKKARK